MCMRLKHLKHVFVALTEQDWLSQTKKSQMQSKEKGKEMLLCHISNGFTGRWRAPGPLCLEVNHFYNLGAVWLIRCL